MKITASPSNETDIKADVIILPLVEDLRPEEYADLDKRIGGLITKVIAAKEFAGKQNQFTLLHVQNLKSERLLLAGLGKRAELTPELLRRAGGGAFSYVNKLGVHNVAISVRSLYHSPRNARNKGAERFQRILYFMEGGLLGNYRFEKYRKVSNGAGLKSITVLDNTPAQSFKRLNTVISAVYLARDLVNTPSNDLTPVDMSNQARAASGNKVKVTVLDEKKIKRESMGAYLSVAQGSVNPPRFIVMEYRGGKGDPLVLIGKAVTFDSGGISIKPADGMEKMKYDMAGGAAVIAVMKAVSEMALPLNIIGIVPAAENLPGGAAFKPGDVVTAINNKTIEIISTDAEGRLTLADAIGYARKYCKPSAIIDIATLTGACSIALGNAAIAMMGNSSGLMDELRSAAEETYERVWQMPLYDEYKEYLKSDVADMKNAGGRVGSLVAAGYFLKEFAGETPWVHLDIAGTAWHDKESGYIPKGSSGIGVRLIIDFLERRATGLSRGK
ncbi:MAG: leucyl aminopeptidase [Nitrospirae bacterium]|nr:leucyl aminopeptidase [Nitrospirota bacterium]